MKNFKHSWIDLHLHLDGSLSVKSVRQLAAMQNIDIPKSDKELEKLLICPDDCKDLNQYLKCFDFPLQLLQTKEAITKSVQNLIEELKCENVVYAEIRFAPQLHCTKGLSQQTVVEAAIDGLSDNMKLILCCMRGDNNDNQNMETVKIAQKYLGKGVVAVDLAGAEALFPTSKYTELFKYASDCGVPFTIHAGEAAGAESVKKAIEYGAKRIGHGVRSFEDKNVLDMLKKSDIMLEMCPTSNLNTCVISDIHECPAIQYQKYGIPVCINTDNRTVSNTTIQREYKLLADAFGLSDNDIDRMLMTAIKHSFADDFCKKKIKDMIQTVNN